MLQVARLSPRLLGKSADLVAQFLASQRNDDGGFCDRGGTSDLYYTVFGLEGLLSLEAEPSLRGVDAVARYLRRFGGGEGLDLTHLACLARAWADLSHPTRVPPARRDIARRIESYRSRDGGYGLVPDARHGCLYGAFLALGGYLDLGLELPASSRLLLSIERLRSCDGGYSNEPGCAVGLTPATAAAVWLLRHLGQAPEPGLGSWLLARHYPWGGFFASPRALVPDLLSTATALHALSSFEGSVASVREPCLDFVDTLWTSRGGFFGHWEDDTLDCEYTFYGLLALGHLSLE